jgi:hypothetical protein
MRTRLAIAAVLYMMVQGVLFGFGVIAILATPLSANAQTLIPWLVGISALISVPLAWTLAPRLRARFHRPALARAR